MEEGQVGIVERIQRLIVRIVATNAAGHGLCLIGGFRYRLLDGGPRHSLDVDYHWDGDLDKKQKQLADVFARRLLPEVKRTLGCDGNVSTATNPGADSPFVRVVTLAFWPTTGDGNRFEVPVDITRIICLDKPTVRTVDGVLYRTPTDQDMVESKVLAVFARNPMQYRDMVDIFLFSNHLGSDSATRIRQKFTIAELHGDDVRKLMTDLIKYRDHHIRAVQQIVTIQLDHSGADTIRDSGGAATVFDAVLAVLHERLKLDREPIP